MRSVSWSGLIPAALQPSKLIAPTTAAKGCATTATTATSSASNIDDVPSHTGISCRYKVKPYQADLALGCTCQEPLASHHSGRQFPGSRAPPLQGTTVRSSPPFPTTAPGEYCHDQQHDVSNASCTCCRLQKQPNISILFGTTYCLVQACCCCLWRHCCELLRQAFLVAQQLAMQPAKPCQHAKFELTSNANKAEQCGQRCKVHVLLMGDMHATHTLQHPVVPVLVLKAALGCDVNAAYQV